jgi:hypothetical protein
MHLSKLIHALKAFDENQFKALKEYIHSPYFHVTPSAVTLFDYLAPLYPGFPAKKLKVEFISTHQKKFSTSLKQRKASTELLKYIDHFIAIQDWQQDLAGISWNQMQGIKRIGLFEHFNKDYKHIISEVNKNCGHSIDSFYQRHLYSELTYHIRASKRCNGVLEEMKSMVNSLDEFYAIKRIRYQCDFLMRRQDVSLPPSEGLESLITVLKPYTSEEYPFVYIFVNIYHLLAASSYENALPYYILLKDYAINQKDDSIPFGLIDGMSYIIHHCLYWCSHGSEMAGQEYLWWVDFKMKSGWLLYDGKLMPNTFRNIVLLAVHYRSAKWMDQFILLYHPFLPEKDQESNVAFARGLNCYKLKEYKESIRYFLRAQSKVSCEFNCIIRRWLWISGYEYDRFDFETLQNQLLSFEKFVLRNAEELYASRMHHEKFNRYAAKLIAEPRPKLASKILHELSQEDYFPGKKWLERKFLDQNPSLLLADSSRHSVQS